MRAFAMSARAAAVLAVVALSLAGILAAIATAGASTTPGSQALALLADVLAGRDAAVVATFDAKMKSELSAKQLAAVLTVFEMEFGSYRGHGSPSVVPFDAQTVVRVPLRMSRKAGEFRVAFDARGQVAGLFFLRTGVPL